MRSSLLKSFICVYLSSNFRTFSMLHQTLQWEFCDIFFLHGFRSNKHTTNNFKHVFLCSLGILCSKAALKKLLGGAYILPRT